MLIYKYAIRFYLILRYFFHRLTATGCFSRNRAASVVPGPVLKKGHTLKAALHRHHVKQFHESSCSVASVVSVVNAILEKSGQLPHGPVTQKQILDRVRAANWKERMGPNGYKGRRGLPLEVLGEVVQASLLAYGIHQARVETVRALRGKAAKRIKKKLAARLAEFEHQDNCLIIAHFDQGSYIRELNIPHISPVGGFDPDTGRVTVLDVDPGQALPYQVSFDTFYQGISTHYGRVFTPFGYARGGYIHIGLAKDIDLAN